MIRLKVSTIFFVLFALSMIKAVDLSREQKAGLFALASEYAAKMTAISKCGTSTKGDLLRSQIHDLFATHEDFVHNRHVNDLFQGESNLSMDEYITCLEENYRYGVVVDYKLKEISDCMESSSNGRPRGYVTFTKTLNYGGQTNTYDEVVAIELSGGQYKIKEAFFPADYSKSGSCDINAPIDESKVLFNRYVETADNAFAQRDYIKAKDAYERALSYRSDSRVSGRVTECANMINLDVLKAKAQNYMNSGDYDYARDLWQQIVNRYPSEKGTAQEKIAECNRLQIEKQFRKQVREADALFSQQFYQQAQGSYQQALNYKPNDSYVLQRIGECKMKDASYIRGRINEAIRLAENENRLKEAFEILYNVEQSGLLNGQNYYFMAMMMDGREQRVDRYMDFTKNMCDHLAVVYCRKAMSKGYQKAEDMWDNIFTNQTRNK